MQKGRGTLVELPSDGQTAALHQRIVAHLRKLIVDGALAPGARLPAQRLLAKDLRVSRNTIISALEQLVSEGFLETRIGSGTYVAPGVAAPRKGPRPRLAPEAPPLALPLEVGISDAGLFPIEVWNQVQSKRWKRMPRSALQEEHPSGWPGLRELIAAQACAMRGLSYSPEQVIIVPTAQAAVDLAARALARPGDVAWIEDPGYYRARSALTNAGLNVRPVPVDTEGFNLHRTPEGEPAKIVYVTPGAQFPTGVTMSSRRRRELLSWATSEGAWIIEDDYEAEFWFGERPPPPLAAEGAERVVYVGTLNNVMYTSLRIAYLVAPGEAVGRILSQAAGHLRAMNIPMQVVLQDFMEQSHLAAHVRACRRVFADRQEVLLDALRDRCPELRVSVPLQGLVVQAWLPEGLSDIAVKREAAHRNVVVSAMTAHATLSYSPGLFLGFAPYTPSAISRAIDAVAESVDALAKKA